MRAKLQNESRRVVTLQPQRAGHGKKSLGRFRSTREVDGHCVTLASPDSYEAGHYLRLRYAVEANRPTEKCGMVVGVCSPAAGDGKSLTALNLAGALAQRRGSRILLVDADLRRRSEVLRHLVPVPGALSPGLSELLLTRQHDVQDVARKLEHTNIWAVLTGSFPIAPYEAFSSERFGLFIERARSTFDYVVLDAPPVVAVPDCKVLAQWVDGLVMVVAANQTPRLLLAQALETLGPEKIIGLLFNKIDQLPPRYHRYYGKYGYAARAKVEDIGHIANQSTNSRIGSDNEIGGDFTARL